MKCLGFKDITKKKALITGITGMDGANLARHLLSIDYNVAGIIRYSSSRTTNTWRIKQIEDSLKLYSADLLDYSSVNNAINDFNPDEIYHLGAMSHVGESFKQPLLSIQSICNGTAHILEAARISPNKIKIYLASTSEMFGRNIDKDGFQRESTPFAPSSPYACAKVFAHNLGENYRNSYSMFVSSGILFNHTGPLRGDEFFEQKVVKAAVNIAKGKQDVLKVGNLNSYRDFSDSEDFVKGMHLMLQHSSADTFVLASGQTHSMQSIVDYVFDKLHIPKNKIQIDPQFFRPEEVDLLKGDASKARKILKWKPESDIFSTLNKMIECAAK